ncbi:MAG: hypothetical protein H6831_04770 [Planctomycetes bacterium]|nr:hypothetical protein [Planctomycetota bacterium]MCB9903702.1 hypothetical protein [Planctomycetota bacterium]
MSDPRTILVSLVSLTLSQQAFATDLVVDAAGGPGVDHTTLSAAVAAALPGDTIFVRNGVYPESISSQIGLRIVGEGTGTRLTGDYDWHDLAPDEELWIGHLALDDLRLNNCLAPVVLDGVTMDKDITGFGGPLHIRDCVDVRVTDLDLEFDEIAYEDTPPPINYLAAVTILGSSVEITGSVIDAGRCRASDFFCIDAVYVGLSSQVVIGSSIIEGGDANGPLHPDCFDFPGACEEAITYGGEALLALGGSNVLVMGSAPSDYLQGGLSFNWPRVAALYSQENSHITVSGPDFNGLLPQLASIADPPAPYLERRGPDGGATDGVLRLRAVAAPYSAVVLMSGARPARISRPVVEEPLLLLRSRVVYVGNTGADGSLEFDVSLPANLAPGATLVAQALVTDHANGRRLTNSLPFLVD